MYSGILNQKVMDLNFSCTLLNSVPHYYFTLFLGNISIFGYRLKFSSDLVSSISDVELIDNNNL